MASLRFTDAAENSTGYSCTSCGGALFGGNRLCQACRRKKTTKTFIGAFIFCEVAMAGFFMVIQPALHHQSAGVALQDSLRPPDPIPTGSGWIYYDTQDSVVGDVTHHARLISDSPSNPSGDRRLAGVANGTLELSSSERYGRVISLTFPKAKTACEANPCEVRAIFDQTQPMVLPYTDASDPRTTVLMLHDYDRFTQRLAVAHDLTVVASLGTEHDHIISFDVAGYRRIADLARPAGIKLAAR